MTDSAIPAQSQSDVERELTALDQNHAQNEGQRDTFLAIAHTALFAASISFVGDVTPLGVAKWKPFLILGWIAGVVGLLALTVSFWASRKAIDAGAARSTNPRRPTAPWSRR